MEKRLKEIEVALEECTINRLDHWDGTDIEYKYTIKSKVPLNFIQGKVFIEEEVPTKISEFTDLHNISKSELVEWLNENYKK